MWNKYKFFADLMSDHTINYKWNEWKHNKLNWNPFSIIFFPDSHDEDTVVYFAYVADCTLCWVSARASGFYLPLHMCSGVVSAVYQYIYKLYIVEQDDQCQHQ